MPKNAAKRHSVVVTVAIVLVVLLCVLALVIAHFVMNGNVRPCRKAQGKRELHYVAGADHAESVLVAPGEYRETVESFLDSLA